MLTIALGVLWFLLPAYAANMTPVFLGKIFGARLNTPVDFGKSWRGTRIFGDHKTWRGLIGGTIVGVLAGILQQRSAPSFASIALVNYSVISAPLLGGLLGFGALFGDAVKSFFKRRVGIPPGGRWIPFDQVDLVLGAFLVSFPFYPIPFQAMLAGLLLTLVGALLFKPLGYFLHLSDVIL